MNIQAFLDASLAVQVHSAFGVFAFLAGGYLLARRKGGRVHRLLGRAWIGAMAVVALSAVFINELRMWGPFSPLHLFIPVTLASCWLAVFYARTGRPLAHAQTVVGLYLGGVIVAGGVTFLPGRMMHEMFLGGEDRALPAWIMDPIAVPLGLALLAVVLSFLAGPRWVVKRRRDHTISSSS